MVLVEIFGLQIEASSGLPLVLLREVDEPHRILPIFIGGPEALAIARGLQGVTAERPLTHDLLIDLLERTGSRIDEVAVTELRDRTFIAELRLDGPSGHRVVSSRPSDAIALAVRVGAPVYASEDVLDEAGAVLQEGTISDEPEEAIEEAVEEFREFLEGLKPSDFQGAGSRPVEETVVPEADPLHSEPGTAAGPGAGAGHGDAFTTEDDTTEDDEDEDAVPYVEGQAGEASNGDAPPDEGGPDDDADGGNGSSSKRG
jgi:bifunctional DNase/RNase